MLESADGLIGNRLFLNAIDELLHHELICIV
jgi:hypothetical protein